MTDSAKRAMRLDESRRSVPARYVSIILTRVQMVKKIRSLGIAVKSIKSQKISTTLKIKCTID